MNCDKNQKQNCLYKMAHNVNKAKCSNSDKKSHYWNNYLEPFNN